MASNRASERSTFQRWRPNRVVDSPTRPDPACSREFEADQVARVLTDADVVVMPIVAVHGAQVPWGKVVTQGVPVVLASRLPSMLRQLPAVLGPERVVGLASQARVRLHAAA